MRLTRIEATRFGRLQDVSLGPFGDGLTVVLGPNEAGKSSFTALVRYLLYGFPTEKSVSERPYLSDAGTREGRLVFESAEGEWVVERTAGPKGGPSSVRAVRGAGRPGLIDELTSGVSEQAFKVVFGFGLAEMAAIERLRGTDDDIIARLYAAGAGLSVSPQEVRTAIEADADALYRPRGSKPVVNALLAEGRELRSRILELEHDAERLAADRVRLQDLATQLEDARLQRDETAAHHRTLFEEARVLSGFEETVRDAEDQLLTLRRTAREAAEAAAAVTVDERVLEASADIESLAEELSAFRKSLEDVRELEAGVGSRASDAAARIAEAGLDEASAAAVDVTPETRAGVERWRDSLLTAEQSARHAAAERDKLADEAAVAAREAGAPGTPSAGPGPSPDVPAWIAVAVAGVAIAALGAFLAQWLVAGAGVVLAIFAAWMVVRARMHAPAPASDTGHVAERATDLTRRAEEAALAAGRAGQEAAEVRSGWEEFRAGRGLHDVAEPAAVVRVLDLVGEARRIEADRAEVARRLADEQEVIAAYVARVAALAALLDLTAPAGAAETPATVTRLRELLADARAAADAAQRAAEDAVAAAAAVADAEARQAHAAGQAQELIERLDVPGGLAELSVALERAELDAGEAQDRWGALGKEYASLETRIGEREREDTMGVLRLDLVSVNERISEHAERYAVLSVAARLLQRAQDRYERERQPEVVREAERIFSTITGGGYPRLSVPLGSSAIEVFDAAARAKDTARLSTGTAEQLYLALRLALIGQLGTTGAALPVLMDDVFANFDPERKAGAAAAVAELARGRQVIVFTCHPATAEALGAVETGLTTLSLDRC